MNCYVCKDVELIWGGDDTAEDIGEEEDYDTILTNLSCPECNSYVEVLWNGHKVFI